jgi:hypothetical protein
MSHALSIRLEGQTLIAVGVEVRGDRPQIAFARIISVAPDQQGLAVAGGILRESLATHKWNRGDVVAAIPRSVLQWQAITLPPSPTSDLPDLVRLQAQREMNLSDDGVGFDFLPLEGGESSPWRVLAANVAPAEMQRLRAVCGAAELRLARVAPEALGWLALLPGESTRKEASRLDSKTEIAVTLGADAAAIWALRRGQLCAFRRFPWSEDYDGDLEAQAEFLAGEVRRTLLTLPDAASSQTASVRVMAEQPASLAKTLTSRLGRAVEPAPISELADWPKQLPEGLSPLALAPLVGLAKQLASGQAPLVDLLSPRRGPAPPNRTRPLALGAAAGLLGVAVAAWSVYRNITTPLAAAAAADVELKSMERELTIRAKDESAAAEIERWLDGRAELLKLLGDASLSLRPDALSAPDYKVDQDVCVTKISTSGRRTTLNVSARKGEAIPLVEQRLREAGYHVDRGPIDFQSKAVADYPLSVALDLETAEPLSATAESESKGAAP